MSMNLGSLDEGDLDFEPSDAAVEPEVSLRIWRKPKHGILDSTSKNVLARCCNKMWRYNSITRTSSDLRRDEGEQATVLREFARRCHHPLSTGVVQSTVIYYFFCDPFGGNLSVVWSPRGRPWCSGWEAHKKILRTATPQ
ncbi:hypothetical protein D6C87_07819 [Aureobasidium pullulans]|uniref:Uncharacterized protein n=1 Tax=Aureobasidium pullulans TaxID=5580 RepID=A0AB38M333_AURPU|nr:hypothetical protein D6C94_03687 [Aureobasidium pullulans]THZ38408.1 hypothetical protein D6C87_07819 [Aureobasidium pullulans]